MEHHSNDLPHRAHGEVLHVGLEPTAQGPGAVSLHALDTLLHARPGEVNYIAVTAASNVTGLVNPIHDIAELAHRHGALVVVDGAQSTAHMRIRLRGRDCARDIDAYFFSGHKVYAPGSPGVLVVKRALLHGTAPLELGGGIVEDVTASSYRLLDSPAAQIAGTPNVLGAVTLAAALEGLRQIGMEEIAAHERVLARHMIARLGAIPGLEIYGPTDLDAHPRVGCIGFNLTHVEHALAAALLNDEFNVAVRNGCFCAHPYTRSLLGGTWQAIDTREMDDLELERYVAVRRGMVRASVGAYTTIADINALAHGVREIGKRVDDLRRGYIVDGAGARARVPRAGMPNFQPAPMLLALLRGRGVLA
jgi:selenocysteine lyase/cysteine desulfurase